MPNTQSGDRDVEAVTHAPVLAVQSLTCSLSAASGRSVRLVNDVSFELRRGRTLGIVGESGSGKSILARSLMGLQPAGSAVTGQARLNGRDVLAMNKNERRRCLGREIAIVLQNPMTSLNPVVPIGRQITEAVRAHRSVSRAESEVLALELLRRVGIGDPRGVMVSYPHQLSGGMRQRVTIASALMCDPDVLIADEATTALDVTIQRQILDLLSETQAERQMAMILISHDLGVVAGRTDDVAVMYSGQIVEYGPTLEIFRRHRHRYTEALLDAVPNLTTPPHSTMKTIPGAPPSPAVPIEGCRFYRRCAYGQDDCLNGAVPMMVWGHAHRCRHPAEPALSGVIGR